MPVVIAIGAAALFGTGVVVGAKTTDIIKGAAVLGAAYFIVSRAIK